MRHRSSRAGSSMPNGRALIPRRSSAQIARASVTASGNTCPMTRAKPGESSLQRRIKERMAELGIPSWRALSLRAGLGETLVKTIMNGRSRAPRSDTIRSLARALKLSPDELFEAVPHSERAPQPEDETTRLRKLRGLRLTAARVWDWSQLDCSRRHGGSNSSGCCSSWGSAPRSGARTIRTSGQARRRGL
jgi:transcriptional regulator with XRE-family HTH domain